MTRSFFAALGATLRAFRTRQTNDVLAQRDTQQHHRASTHVVRPMSWK